MSDELMEYIITTNDKKSYESIMKLHKHVFDFKLDIEIVRSHTNNESCSITVKSTDDVIEKLRNNKLPYVINIKKYKPIYLGVVLDDEIPDEVI